MRGSRKLRLMRHWRSAILLLCALASAAGCAAPVGDFGRPRPSYFNDTILPAVGEGAAWARGAPVSFGPLTDDERELRDLAYAIIMPEGDQREFERMLVELVRTRVLPDEYEPYNPAGYSDVLLTTAYRSSTARYSRLMDDIRADSARAGPFFAAAKRVAEMDTVRAKALANMPYLPPAERESATARIHENRALVAWVQRRLGERHESYRLALQRLVVATPAPAAIEAERTLRLFETRLAEIPEGIEIAWLDSAPGEAAVSK